MKTAELVAYGNGLLEISQFKDYCPNGLQVEGKHEVRKIVSGVTASLALIEAAAEAQADLLLVHHGYFWKSENPCLTGMKARRIRALVQSNMNLLAYHLPLDAHPVLGNNRQFGDRLGITWMGTHEQEPLINIGELVEPLSSEDFAARLAQCCGREPAVIASPDGRVIKRVAWCTGAAQGYLETAASLGLDAYVSGEISEQTFHVARELGIHYFAAGHHATERFGVQALGDHLADKFKLEHQYIDILNPV